MKQLCCLIRAFLETAINPSFRHNLFHETLFRYHVLDEVDLGDPGLPPYYDKQFFDTIRHYHETSPLNIAVMSTKQWYTVLMEDRVLMSPATDDSPPCLLPVRVESMYPSNDWSNTWRRSRIKGLDSELTAFLFKLLHGLLPTQDRIARLGASEGHVPGMCLHCHTDVEDPIHAFFSCPHSMVAGLALLGWVQGLAHDVSPEEAILLQLDENITEIEELAVVYLLATGLKYIWESRMLKKQITLHQLRSELEAKVSILRKSRHKEAGEKMLELLDK